MKGRPQAPRCSRSRFSASTLLRGGAGMGRKRFVHARPEPGRQRALPTDIAQQPRNQAGQAGHCPLPCAPPPPTPTPFFAPPLPPDGRVHGRGAQQGGPGIPPLPAKHRGHECRWVRRPGPWAPDQGSASQMCPCPHCIFPHRAGHPPPAQLTGLPPWSRPHLLNSQRKRRGQVTPTNQPSAAPQSAVLEASEKNSRKSICRAGQARQGTWAAAKEPSRAARPQMQRKSSAVERAQQLPLERALLAGHATRCALPRDCTRRTSRRRPSLGPTLRRPSWGSPTWQQALCMA